MSFSSLKKTRTQSFEKLNNELSKLNTNPFQDPDEDTYWNIVVDKSGNGYAVIRFLPAPDGEDVPFVRIWDHFFKGPTSKIYAEKSLTSIGQKDPVYELNGRLWATGNEADKKKAQTQGRNLRFISNIYIVEDPANPENNGKVFRFKYGKKIFDKLNDAMNPKFPDEPRLNPFDLWDGANFKLKARTVDGYRNYDKSEFETPEPLLDDDDKLEEVYKKEYSLQELLEEKKFKPYEELEKKLHDVLGTQSVEEIVKSVSSNHEEKENQPTLKEKSSPEKESKTSFDEDEEDFDFSKFLEDD